MINEIRKINAKIHEIEEDEIIKDIRNHFRLKRKDNSINQNGDRKSLLKKVFIIQQEIVFFNKKGKKTKKAFKSPDEKQ